MPYDELDAADTVFQLLLTDNLVKGKYVELFFFFYSLLSGLPVVFLEV